MDIEFSIDTKRNAELWSKLDSDYDKSDVYFTLYHLTLSFPGVVVGGHLLGNKESKSHLEETLGQPLFRCIEKSCEKDDDIFLFVCRPDELYVHNKLSSYRFPEIIIDTFRCSEYIEEIHNRYPPVLCKVKVPFSQVNAGLIKDASLSTESYCNDFFGAPTIVVKGPLEILNIEALDVVYASGPERKACQTKRLSFRSGSFNIEMLDE